MNCHHTIKLLKAGITACFVLFLNVSCNDDIIMPADGTAFAPADEEAVARTSLTLETSTTNNQIDFSYDSSTGVYTITPTGNDPYIGTNRFRPLSKGFPEEQVIFTFDYQCTTGLNDMQFFFAPDLTEARSVRSITLAPTSGDEWGTFNLDISKQRTDFDWPKKWTYNYMRIDFGSSTGVTIKLKNIAIRERTAKEQSSYEENSSFNSDKEQFAQNVTNYLNATFSSQVSRVEVTSSEVVIRGTTSGTGRFALTEITPYEDITEMETFPHNTPIRTKQFSIRLPRYVERDGFNYDRLLSKWAIVSLDGGTQTLASHAHYADVVEPIRSPQEVTPRNKKGVLGCPNHAIDGVRDIDVMNYGMTANVICVEQWLMNEPLTLTDYGYTNGYPAIPYNYNGRQYYINGYKVMEYDALIKAYNQHNMIVIAYPEVRPNENGYPNSRDPYISSLMVHPERNGGTQLMPNVTSPEAINAFAAVINFLADRYSQPGMRIHHWCIYNEVNATETWCNMGRGQPEMYFTDTYMKSLRLWYNIVRQYDQNASVLACFEHNWATATNNDSCYPAASIINSIKKYSNAEGDFWWGLAHHPYPYNLSVSRFWEYDGQFVNFTQSTPQVTFYNLEVLQDWAYTPENMYQGTTKRKIFLTEQGVNTVDYSDEAMADQAAGACYVWKKVNALSAIDGITWHANVDNTGDGALRLGLHQYATNGNKRKPSWYVWKAAGTSDEDEVFGPYLSVLGFTSWNEVMH